MQSNIFVSLLPGDCLALMRELEGESIDCILCDLPYGGMTRNKWDQSLPEQELWQHYRRLIKPHGAIILFSAGRFTASLIHSAGELFRYTLVWHKTTPTGFLNANRQPLRAHEDIVVCYKRQPAYHPQKTHGHKRKVSTATHKRDCVRTTNYGSHGLSTYDSTERYPTSVLTFSTDKQRGAYHPTQKPVPLLEWLILSYTNEGDIVLDNCMGSGSTGVACVNTRRSFIGMELDPAYFEIAQQRIAAARGMTFDAERRNMK